MPFACERFSRMAAFSWPDYILHNAHGGKQSKAGPPWHIPHVTTEADMAV